MATEVKGALDEKEGVLVVGEGDKTTRYVKEADLLALKSSRVSKEDVAKEVEKTKQETLAESNTKLDAALQRALEAEARVSSLQDNIKKGGATGEELVKLKNDLETAKKSGEILGSKYLELKRNNVLATYKVPKATVEKKSLEELEVFEEALKAVVGSNTGNYAAGGGGGGSGLQGSPYELAIQAYASSNKK